MSETITPNNTATEEIVDPVEQALDIMPPEEATSKKKKGIPKGVKIGMGVMGAGVLFLMAMQMMTPAPQPSTQTAGTIAVKVPEASGFQTSGTTAVPVNPEAIALSTKVNDNKANEVLKDPSKSYVTADPFGNTNTSGTSVEKPAEPLAPVQPPPAPELYAPTTQKGQANGNGQEEDPVLSAARKIYAMAIATPKPQISIGNTPMPTAASVQTGATSNGLTAQGEKPILPADVGAGEIAYAQLTSLLNSIVPQTPPRAVIRGGKLNGGVLLGQMETVESRYLVLKFTTLTLGKKTYPISAIAVNTEMQDAGMVDTVKDRTWTRAALQAGVGFVQSFGAAKLEEGTQSSTSATGQTTSSVPVRSNEQTAVIALGGAAQAVKPTVDQEIQKIKDEVIVKPGKEMGVLFLQPLYLQ